MTELKITRDEAILLLTEVEYDNAYRRGCAINGLEYDLQKKLIDFVKRGGNEGRMTSLADERIKI